MLRGIGLGAFLALTLAMVRLAVSPVPDMTLTLAMERDTARVTATWAYTPPPDWTVDYVWTVTDAANDTVAQGETPDHTAQVPIPREALDVAMVFEVRIRRLDPYPAISDPRTFPFLVPAREAYVVVLEDVGITAPRFAPHDPAMVFEDGTVLLEFTPGNTVARQGLFSKDHNGYGTGGHLSIWIMEGTANARIQDLDTSYTVTGDGLVAGVLNQVAVSFGPGGFVLYVNGVQKARDPYTGGLLGNTESVALGADSQNDLPGESGPMNPLDGTLDQVRLVDGQFPLEDFWGEAPPEPPPDRDGDGIPDVDDPCPDDPTNTCQDPPPPVDSLNVRVAHVDWGLKHQESFPGRSYALVYTAPIMEAATLVAFVDGLEYRRTQARVAPAMFPMVVTETSGSGWVGYKPPPGLDPFDIPPHNPHQSMAGWTRCETSNWGMGGECGISRRGQIETWYREAPCDDPFYNVDLAEVCNFSPNAYHVASFQFPTGSNPTLRLEVLDGLGSRIGYWETVIPA